MYVYIYVHVCMYVCVCVCMHACMYACMHVCMYLSSMYICVYVCLFVIDIASSRRLLKSLSNCDHHTVVKQIILNYIIAKDTIQALASLLSKIVSCSFRNGIVPIGIKVVKIIPLFKSGTKNKINNYRPISILPYFSKYFEKLMPNGIC